MSLSFLGLQLRCERERDPRAAIRLSGKLNTASLPDEVDNFLEEEKAQISKPLASLPASSGIVASGSLEVE